MSRPPIRLEPLGGDADGRRRSPSANRNRGEILPVLQRVLPARGTVLEIASGTGEHAVYFAARLPHLVWQPSERDAEALESIRAWRQQARTQNLREPMALDVMADWPATAVDAVVAINVLHITPWAMTLRLLAQASELLAPGGPLVVYGAMLRGDRPTAPSNLSFDAELRAADPAYGVRRLEDLNAAAAPHGLDLDEVVDMPNNNVVVVLRLAPGCRSTPGQAPPR